MPRTKKAARDVTPAQVSVVEDSVSVNVEEDDTEELGRREVFQARQTLSLGNGSYRTLPQFND